MNESLDMDPEAVQRLQRLGGDSFVCKMINVFLEYSEKRIGEAQAAAASGDSAAVGKVMHSLKSSAGNIGACRVQVLAERVEALAEQGASEALHAALGDLAQAFAAVKPALEKRRDEIPPAQ